MNWRLRQLLPHLIKEDECEDYVIYVVPQGRMVTASLPGRGPYRTDERQVEQVEFHSDPDWPHGIIVIKDDYDNPISEVDLESDGVKFRIYESVIEIG